MSIFKFLFGAVSVLVFTALFLTVRLSSEFQRELENFTLQLQPPVAAARRTSSTVLRDESPPSASLRSSRSWSLPMSSSSSSSSSSPQQHRAGSSYMTSCMLIMDDNHWLVEWLAYHWTTVDLRYMIIAIDERSRTSPVSILDRWRGQIEFELWNDSHFFENKPDADEGYSLQEMNLLRQKTFLAKCMHTLKERHNETTTWVLFTDTDEFITVNPRARLPGNQLYRPYAPDWTQRGSILQFLHREKQEQGTLCFSMGRLQLSPDESPTRLVSSRVPFYLDGKDFLTTRWLRPADDLVGPKNVVDLSSVPRSQIPRDRTHQHRVLPEFCGTAGHTWNRNNSLLQIYHYLGTFEQYQFRDDPRLRLKDAGRNTRYARYQNVSTEVYDDLRPWLTAFVAHVGGKSEALRLLDGAGRTTGWPGAETHLHRYAKLPAPAADDGEGGDDDEEEGAEEESEGESVVNLEQEGDDAAESEGAATLPSDDNDDKGSEETVARDKSSNEDGDKNSAHAQKKAKDDSTNRDDQEENDDAGDDEAGDDSEEIGGGGEEDEEGDDENEEEVDPNEELQSPDASKIMVERDESLSITAIEEDYAPMSSTSKESFRGNLLVERKSKGERSSSMMYSQARRDRSGAVVADMLLAHAYAHSKNLTYGGACAEDGPMPYREPAEQLIASIGLDKWLVFACPTERGDAPILTRKDYAIKNTRLFTDSYLEWVRSHVRYPSRRHGGTVMHVRRGDVSPCSKFANRYLPNSHYTDIATALIPDGVPVTIFSESQAVEPWTVFLERNYTLRLDTDLLEAWHAMMTADYVVLSKSSFSFVPALLNRNATIIYTPFMQRNLPGWVTVPDAILVHTRERVSDLIQLLCTPDEARIARASL